MDKYQKAFLKGVYGKGFQDELHFKNVTSENSGAVCGEIDIENGKITVNQEKDINSTVYRGYVPAFYGDKLVFKAAFLSFDGKEWEEVALSECVKDYDGGYDFLKLGFDFKFDFNNRIKKIKLCFAGGLAEDFELDVIFNEADREAYYKAQREAERRNLIADANIEYQGCINMLAVYFTPCREDYKDAEMDLYWGEDKFMGTYKSTPLNFSLVAMGLRHGGYNFVLRQKDKAGKVIFETDKIPVTVSNTATRENYIPKLPDA